MAFVAINHGWTNTRSEGHWQRIAAAALRNAGHQVFYPQYPNTQQPNFADWSALLQAELGILLETRAGSTDPNGEVVLIAHSLGCVNFLKNAQLGLLPHIDRVLLVAPPAPEKFATLEGFEFDQREPSVLAGMNATAGSVTLIGSDADVWSPAGVQAAYGDPLGLRALVIPGAGHFTINDGWGKWQGLLDWVTDPSANLSQR
jgi:predicted alpha/beta hydrolase family esterase